MYQINSNDFEETRVIMLGNRSNRFIILLLLINFEKVKFIDWSIEKFPDSYHLYRRLIRFDS